MELEKLVQLYILHKIYDRYSESIRYSTLQFVLNLQIETYPMRRVILLTLLFILAATRQPSHYTNNFHAQQANSLSQQSYLKQLESIQAGLVSQMNLLKGKTEALKQSSSLSTTNQQKLASLRSTLSEQQNILNTIITKLSLPYDAKYCSCSPLDDSSINTLLSQISQTNNSLGSFKTALQKVSTCKNLSSALNGLVSTEKIYLETVQQTLKMSCVSKPPTPKECPQENPVYDAKTGSCKPCNGYYDSSKKTCTSYIYLTPPDSSNILLQSQTLEFYQESYKNLLASGKQYISCPSATPFSTGSGCISCPEDAPLFDVDSKACAKCPYNSQYDQNSHQCMQQMVQIQPTIERMFMNTYP